MCGFCGEAHAPPDWALDGFENNGRFIVGTDEQLPSMRTCPCVQLGPEKMERSTRDFRKFFPF